MRSSGSPEPGRQPDDPGPDGPDGPDSPRSRHAAGAGYAGLPVGAFLDALAAASPAPAAGSAAALVLAQAAALCAKAARLSAARLGESKAAELTAGAEQVRAAATALADADASAYQEVIAAGRGGAAGNLAAALSRAADVPMEVVALAAELAGPAAVLAAAGNPNLRGDAQTAALLGQAAARSAARLVGINLARAGLAGDPRPARAARLLARIDARTAGTAPSA